jgi:hypothetical protein
MYKRPVAWINCVADALADFHLCVIAIPPSFSLFCLLVSPPISTKVSLIAYEITDVYNRDWLGVYHIVHRIQIYLS